MIRTMLKKHEIKWNRKLGDINIIKSFIYLMPGVHPFKTQQYRAGQNTRDLKHSEIHKQLEASAI